MSNHCSIRLTLRLRKAVGKPHRPQSRTSIGSSRPTLERTIQAKLPDERGTGIEITLHLDQTVHQNAQFYFAKGRKDKQQAEGAKEAALEETQKRQKKVEEQRAKDEAAGRVTLAKRAHSGSKGIAGR